MSFNLAVKTVPLLFTDMIDNITFRSYHSIMCHFLDQHACEAYQTQSCDYTHIRI